MKQVDPKTYTPEYYLTECGGWENWQTTTGKKLEPRLRKAFALAKVKAGQKILDFGCGRGELSYHSAWTGADVLGLDYADTALKLAKSLPKLKNGSLKFKKNTNLKLPIENKSIDTIFFIDVYEHMYPRQLEILFKEFRRILKPTGKIVLHTAPNRNYYDYGYKYYTRWVNMLINPIYKLIFKENLNTKKNPRRPYDLKVHINETTVTEIKAMCQKTKLLHAEVWLSSQFRNIRKRDHLRYFLLEPQWGKLKNWFAYDIWAIIKI